LLSDIENGSISSLEQVKAGFRSMHENYTEYEWAWAAKVLQEKQGKTMDEITAEDIIELTKKWKKAVVELDNMLYSDARKEFTATAQTGYGLDGSSSLTICFMPMPGRNLPLLLKPDTDSMAHRKRNRPISSKSGEHSKKTALSWK